MRANNLVAYTRWEAMKRRCSNPLQNNYKYYGGRGIKVCDRWQKFENFLVDMGNPPSKKHTLDRIDNNGNYEPSNCRWATKYSQMRNRSDNNYITINNCRLCISDWAKWIGVNHSTITQRKNVYGWSWPDAILTPPRKKSMSVVRLSDRGVTWDEGTDY